MKFYRLQLSRRTVTRRTEVMNKDLIEQLKCDLNDCVCLSLQFDESTDIVDISQLCVFIRMVFENMSAKEELLKIIPLQGKTRGEDIYNAFKIYIKENDFPIYKLVSMTTDGAASMTGKRIGFLALCTNDDDFPDFLSYHCIIHQQALCCKMLNMKHIMTICTKIVNSIRGRSLQRRLFRSQLEENQSEHGELLYHADVRWLSRGKFLQRFRDLLQEVKEFLVSRDEEYVQLDDHDWLMDLAFLVDITNKLNELNLQFQGKSKTVAEMIGYVNCFKNKLKLLSSQLKKKELKNFPNMADELLKKNCALDKEEKYCEQLEALYSEFERRFNEFTRLEPVVAFMYYPFGIVDVEEVVTRINILFSLDSSMVENEVLLLQSDIQLKALSSEERFWNMMSNEKYTNLKKVAYYLRSQHPSSVPPIYANLPSPQ